MRKPFGLKNALAMYQQAFDTILTTMKWQLSLLHIDDIIVFSSSYEAHKVRLCTVLEFLEAAGVTLGLYKFESFHAEVDHL